MRLLDIFPLAANTAALRAKSLTRVVRKEQSGGCFDCEIPTLTSKSATLGWGTRLPGSQSAAQSGAERTANRQAKQVRFGSGLRHAWRTVILGPVHSKVEGIAEVCVGLPIGEELRNLGRLEKVLKNRPDQLVLWNLVLKEQVTKHCLQSNQVFTRNS